MCSPGADLGGCGDGGEEAGSPEAPEPKSLPLGYRESRLKTKMNIQQLSSVSDWDRAAKLWEDESNKWTELGQIGSSD